MKIPLLLLLFLIFFACETPPTDASRQPDEIFRTTDPSRLYFKNMRAYYYQEDTKPGTKMDTYTLKKFNSADSRPILTPIIVNNWLQDEAYLFLEKNAHPSLAGNSLYFRSLGSVTNETLEFELTIFDKQSQYDLASFLHTHIRAGHTLEVSTDHQEWYSIFNDKKDRGYFLQTMDDYYRLIEKERK